MSRRRFLKWFSLGWLVGSPRSAIAAFSQVDQQPSIGMTSQALTEIIFYVSPDGKDTWTGRLAAQNSHKTDGPFLTLKRVQDAIRALKQQQGSLKQPVRVLIRGGTYFLTEPLTFLPQDSGTQEFPIRFQAYQQEKPIISGGQRLTGWKPVTVAGKRLWATDISYISDVKGKWHFRQLWVNGKRVIRSRHPKKGYLKIAEVPDNKLSSTFQEGRSRFKYHNGDLKNWKMITHAEAVVMSYWVESRLPIHSVREQENLVTFNNATVFNIQAGNTSTSGAGTYYLENAFEFLDTPGEWYLNPETRQLYYIPLPAENMGLVEIIAPRLEQLLILKGDPLTKNFVEHLYFENLTFSHTEWPYPDKFSGFGQAAAGLSGAIDVVWSRQCHWQKCTITHVGNYGMRFTLSPYDNSITGCKIFDLGGGGILLKDGPYNTRITDCAIYDGGRIFHSAVGILIINAPYNLISRNHIYNFYYTGISVGWIWGYGDNYTKGVIIENNHISHIGALINGDGPLLNDKGGIYTLGIQPGTIIRNNLIHDVRAFNYGGWGIYLDEGSSQILVENNLVFNTSDGGFHIHYGKDNIVRNNIFAFGKKAQVRRSRVEPHISFTFERNIVYWDSGQLLDGDGWADGNYRFDYNLYWAAGKGKIMPFETWKRNGQDRHSLIADPQFRAPQKGDFRLKPSSPAFKLGFRPIR